MHNAVETVIFQTKLCQRIMWSFLSSVASYGGSSSSTTSDFTGKLLDIEAKELSKVLVGKYIVRIYESEWECESISEAGLFAISTKVRKDLKNISVSCLQIECGDGSGYRLFPDLNVLVGWMKTVRLKGSRSVKLHWRVFGQCHPLANGM